MEDQERAVREAIARARGQKRGPDEPSQLTETPSGLKSKLMKMSRDLKDSREEVSASPWGRFDTNDNCCVYTALL